MYSKFKAVKCGALTDKTKYRLGEEVILTVSSQDEETVYFYPSDEEMEMTKLPGISKSIYLESLVSTTPGIKGDLVFKDPRLVCLIIQGTNSNQSAEYGIEGFDDPLDPGEKIVFSVKLPKRPGKYILSLIEFFHGNEIGYGANRMVYSNVFEIEKE